MDSGCNFGMCWLACSFDHQSAQHGVSCLAWNLARTTSWFRPAFSRPANLGFPCAIRLGIQREVATRLLGLRSTRASLLLRSVAVNTAGVLVAMFGWMKLSMLLLAAGLVVAIYALRLFEP